MTLRELSRWLIGGGFAVAVFASPSIQAQVDTTRRDTSTVRRDTTRARSTQRIPIRKESRGEVVLPTANRQRDSLAYADSVNRVSQARNDSIMNAERARQDSIARAERNRVPVDSAATAARRDSIARAEQLRTDSLSRVDSIRTDSMSRANPAAGAAQVSEQNTTPGPKLPGAFYYGVAAGRSAPTSDFEDLGYGSGLNISVPIGWHNPASLFGFRVMLGYNQFNGAPFTTGGAVPVVLNNPDPKVYSAELNLNMRLPFNAEKTSAVYLTGGGGVYMFRNFGETSALGAYLGNDVLEPNDEANESSISKWGVNGGAGLEFGIGRSSLFVETRFVNAFTGREDDINFDNAFGSRGTTVRWVPLILGFTIR